MVSLVNQLTSAAMVDIPQTGGGKPQTLQQLTFASFMDQSIGHELNRTANVFGLKKIGALDQALPQMLSLLEQYVAKIRTSINGNEESGQAATPEDDAQKSSVCDLVARLFNIMQMMMNHVKPGPGEWVVELPDNSSLQKLVIDANMTSGEGSRLFNKFGQQNGQVDLNTILSALKNHFDAAKDEQPITAADTSLPILENLLLQFGVSSEEVNNIAQKAVIGNGEFDLARFFAGIEGLGETGGGADMVKLSGWEVQELKDLLLYAGVAPGQINLLFLDNTMGQPVPFTFERLKGMLKSGIDDVVAGRTVPDVGMVLTDLQPLFKEAVFKEQSIGWSPLVQQTINEVRAALAEAAGHVPITDKAVDQDPALAMVQNKVGSISSVPAAMSLPDIVMETQSSKFNPEYQGKSGGENSQASEDALFEVGAGDVYQAKLQATKSGNGPLSSIFTSLSGTSPDDQYFFENFVSSSLSDFGTAGDDFSQEFPQTVGLNGAARDSGSIFNPTPAGSGRLAQAAMVYGQIFNGVLKGLINREHLLNLKIFPPELGEVGVRLSVKDLNVKIAFTMENSAVKAILEENMTQFRNNLEQNGFILEHFSASVGHQSDPRENRSGFFMTQSNTLSLEEQENLTHAEEYENISYTKRPGNTIHLVV